jgi:hypothetical protein
MHYKNTAIKALFLFGIGTLILSQFQELEAKPVKISSGVEKVDFNRDVRAILSDRCFQCHGPNEESRERHLRFDRPDGKEGAFRKRKGSFAIVPGDLKKSLLYERIMSEDPEEVMPPPDSHKKALTDKEKAVLKQWIEEGAKWSDHWAFIKPVKPAVPVFKNNNWPKNPIDNFILAGLNKRGLKPSAEAPRYKLIRRLSYDLNGIPPTPAEVKAFVEDKSPDAYEKLVDRIFAKPAYGERMTLPWLDMARFGDSSVYHADGPRTMWPWRDWVIDAYNNNKAFDQFTIEQLAGDHIKDKTTDQLIATAFLRNNGTTDEGGAFFEEYRVEYTVDRVNTVSSVWLGLTTGCAQCHDHKYDPITQKEFYQMYAFFNISDDPGKQSRARNQAPVVTVPLDGRRKARVKAMEAEITGFEEKKIAHRKKILPQFKKWLEKKTAGSEEVKFNFDSLTHFFGLDSFATLDDAFNLKAKAQLSAGASLAGRRRSFNVVEGRNKKSEVKAIQFNGKHYLHYAQNAEWMESDQAFTVSLWLKYQPGKGNQVIFSKMDKKAKGKGVSLSIEGDKVLFQLSSEFPEKALKIASEKKLKKDQWQFLTLTYDGQKKAEGLKIYIDGVEDKVKIHHNKLEGSVKNKAIFMIGAYDNLRFKGAMRHLQIFNKVLSQEDVLASSKIKTDHFIYNKRHMKNKDFVAAREKHYFEKIDKVALKLDKKIAEKKKEITNTKALNVMVMRDQKKPRKTYILDRGAYDQPLKDEEIFMGTPSALHAMKKDYPKNRLGLAKWIMDEDNPLTARVTVNRYWMMLFGHGIVDTVQDFGNQAAWPTHMELLDWMAVDFREKGWDVKATLKQLVMSATYRQDSNLTAEVLKKDKENRYYARGARFRLTGEHIRDTALFVSGLINPQIGGESVKPYQPPGLWREVALGNATFRQDKGEKNYRKSIYTYYKRSAPIPSMTIYDAPSREKCIVERSRTNTPLHALVSLNDPQFVEASRFFAERIMKSGMGSIDEKIDFAFLNAIARKPSDTTRVLINQLFIRRLADFKKDKKKSEALLAIGGKKRDSALDLSEHAAWTVIAQLLLNLDEALNKE